MGAGVEDGIRPGPAGRDRWYGSAGRGRAAAFVAAGTCSRRPTGKETDRTDSGTDSGTGGRDQDRRSDRPDRPGRPAAERPHIREVRP